MRHDYILKRPDKSWIMISVYYYFGLKTMNYDINVYKREYRKKRWNDVIDDDDWDYRALDMKEREIFKNKEYLKYVTKEEIYDAKIAAWESMKPAGGR